MLFVYSGQYSGDDLLSPTGFLVHTLRRATYFGELTVMALDVCDNIAFDQFSYGSKVKIVEKSLSGVTARKIDKKSSFSEIEAVVQEIRMRWETVCGALLVDIRGSVTIHVVGVKSEQTSPLFTRLCFNADVTDSLCSLVSKALRKGVVRVVRVIKPSIISSCANTPSLFSEIRILRLKAMPHTLLQHTLSSLQVQLFRTEKSKIQRDFLSPLLASELESIIEEMTAATKRVKKARIHAQEAKDSIQEAIDSMPHSTTANLNEVDEVAVFPDAKLQANHSVTVDFFRQFKVVSSLHVDVLDTVRAINSRLYKKRNQSIDRQQVSSDVLSLIDDVICFCCERAVLSSEGLVSATESYAWLDIKGCSTKLKSSDSWHQPLNIQIKTLYPRVAVDWPDHTVFESEDEAEPSVGATATANNTIESPKEKAPDVASKLPNQPVSAADLTQRKLSITKKHDTEEADKKYLMAVYDSLTLVQDVTKYLKAGTVMTKHGRSGSPHPRLFWVSSVVNKTALMWVDPDKRSTSAKTNIPLSDVCSVVLGPFSKVFKRNPIGIDNKDFFLSFSLILRDDSRTIDIVAPTLPDFEAWVLGVSHMAHVDPFWGKRLVLPNDEHSARLSEQEKTLCETWYIFPSAYIAVKDRIVDLRDEVRQHLRLFGNNAEQAFVALGGIHLPQVNHKGAILMTKGELRHHCNSYNVDIFRVCEIWRVLNAQDLVYDPAFTPATNFGLTQRKTPMSGK
eukprot:GILJ01015598.1.p1 GENE.GILJ01015598.1~~GILJ01015598.1.p1  ORF type:complete len:735 (-),score=43.26 GILJ01015598.1:40-2244(-)